MLVKSLTGEVVSLQYCGYSVSMCTLTQARHGVGINVTGQLNRALVLSVGDPAVRQPEALDHTGLSGKFPEDLYSAGI